MNMCVLCNSYHCSYDPYYICYMQAFSFAVLIAAIVTLAALSSIGEYENSEGSRGAAGWMVFVAIAALLFHGAMILVRILYATSVIEKNFSGYAFTVSGLYQFVHCKTKTFEVEKFFGLLTD